VHDTRGSKALGEGHLPRVQHSGKRGTRKRKFAFDGGRKQSRLEEIFPECLALTLGEASLFPECLTLALGEACLFPECPNMALKEGSLPRVLRHGTQGTTFLSFFAPFFCEAFPHNLKLLAQIWGTSKFLGIFC
jgi:hypothetical protein